MAVTSIKKSSGQKISEQKTPEHQKYTIMEHWKPLRRILPRQELFSRESSLFPLSSYIYGVAKEFYEDVPLRKNGEEPFIHPVNVVVNLKKAKVEDEVTLCVGLIHDYVEEKVDLYKKRKRLQEDKKGIRFLDKYEREVFRELEVRLLEFAEQKGIPVQAAGKIIAVTRLLTRHKRDFYYQSIRNIFNCPDSNLKEAAIQVKLADRIHNSLCIDCFSERERIYQCFKNLFILNNAKKHLIDTESKLFSPTERLFTKCCKATHDAFLAICHMCMKPVMKQIRPMLQLAFKKYALEKGGLWTVTKVDKKDIHPVRLFQGIIRKYDAHLNHEWEKFQSRQQDEIEYCRKFFADFNFSKEQIQYIIDYKDAYALKEVVAYLLYQPDYIISHFLTSELSRRGRI